MRPSLPLLVTGAGLAALGLVLSALVASPDVTAAMNCTGFSSSDGCITAQPLIYTAMGTVQRLLPALLPAGLTAIALSIALAGRTRSADPEGAPMTRPQLVLWVLGAALVAVGLVAMVVQSQPDAMSYGMSCDETGCTASPGYSVSVFSAAVSPGLLLGGLLTLVVALAARALAARGAHPVPAAVEVADDGEPEADGELTALFDPAEVPAGAAPALGSLRPRSRREDLSVYMRPSEREE